MPDNADIAGDLQVIVPNLHWRYTGVTATNRMVAPRLAKLFRAAWLGSDAPEGIARMGFGDLLRLWRRPAPLIWHARRNNEMIAGLLLRSLGWPLKLVFTSAAQRHHTALTRWLIRADGRDHRDLVDLGVVFEAGVRRGDAWRRHRGLCAAGGSGGGIRREQIAGALCHRLLRPHSCAEGQRRLCRGDVSLAAALPRFFGRDGRRDHAGPDDVCKRSEEADRSRRARLAHPHHGRAADRGGAALVQAADHLRLHLAQRRFWPDIDRGDGCRRCIGRIACRRGRTRGRGRRHRRADAAGRCRCAGCRAGAVDARCLPRLPRWARARGSACLEKFSLDAEADGIAKVYRTLV